jgi:uncharacterized membrane protein YjgN (DUF898 family)
MSQFENETLRLAAGLFIVFCIVFYFLRQRLAFWTSLPRIVMVACLAWLFSVSVLFVTLRTSFEGLVFAFAYFAAVLMTPPLVAVGMFEVVLGTYASFVREDPTKSFPPQSHFIAALSTFACIGAYFVLSIFSK